MTTWRARLALTATVAAAALPLAGCASDAADQAAADVGPAAAADADDPNGYRDSEDSADPGDSTNSNAAATDDTAAERLPGAWVPQTLTLDGQAYPLPDLDRAADALVTIAPDQPVDEDGSGVYVGCNRTGTEISVEGDTLRVADFVSTMMACGEELDRFEQGTVALLESDPTFALSESGDRLTLTADNGDTLTLTRSATAR